MEQQEQPVVERGEPQVDESTRQFVTGWCERINAAKKYHEKAFKRMRYCMQLAHAGAPEEWINADKYVVPIIAQHIRQAVSAIYAKNPTASVKRRSRLEATVWDGSAEQLEQAMMAQQVATQNMTLPDPHSLAIIQDAMQVQQRQQMLAKLGETLKILFDYFLEEPTPTFKRQFKAAVARVKITGVAYLKLDFQRMMERRPEISGQIESAEQRIAHLERLIADAGDGEVDEESAEVAELRAMLGSLRERETIVVREGPVFDFPASTAIIIDPACRSLDGFLGADWIAHEHCMSPEKIQEIYEVDIKAVYRPYEEQNGEKAPQSVESDERKEQERDRMHALVWEVYHKPSGMTFTVADGYPGLLREQQEALPLERFWPVFPILFNTVESETEIYPFSDVYQLRHAQLEYNRSREGLRQHRIANRPGYVAPPGAFANDEERQKVGTRADHEVIELRALNEGVGVEQMFARIPFQPIDPALYDTTPVFDDVLRSVGTQESQIGGVSGATATESSIAESSRLASTADDVDDIDETLSEFARSAAQLMLLELSPETVSEIVGPGAVWPEMNREQVAKELYLDVQAGSTGRPNKAAELANRERVLPYLVQMPGIKPEPLVKDLLELLDVDYDDMVVEGIPSIVVLNAMAGKQAQPGTGDANDPTAQGAQGGDNAPAPAERQDGPQPAFNQQPDEAPRSPGGPFPA